MHYLFEIEDVFDLSDIGLVVAPGIPHSLPTDLKMVVGSPLLIVAPNGDALRTVVSSFVMIRRVRRTDHAPFAVPKGVTKHQLPVRSKVYALAGTLT